MSFKAFNNSLVSHLVIEIHIYQREVNWRLDEESHFTTSWSNSLSIMLWVVDKKHQDSLGRALYAWISHLCAVGFARSEQKDFWALFSWICAHCALGFQSSKGTLWTVHVSEGGCLPSSWHRMHVSLGGRLARTLDNSFNRRSSSSVALLGDFVCKKIQTFNQFLQLPIKQGHLGVWVLGMSYDYSRMSNLSCLHCMSWSELMLDDIVGILSKCYETVA